MTNQKIAELVHLARENKKKGNYQEAEIQLRTSLSIFEMIMKKDKEPQILVEYLTTKAEYYNLKAKVMLNPSDTPLKMRQNAIRSLECMEQARETIEREKLPNRENVEKNISNTLKNVIEVFGCVVPETENHYIFKCPIRNRNGFGISPSIVLKNPTCSICGKNPTNPEECSHIPGSEYDKEVCRILHKGIGLDHSALVRRPKDPRCFPIKIFMPKADMNKAFTEEELKIKERDKSPAFCHLCKKLKTVPDIDFRTFSKMQRLEEDDIKSSKSSKEMLISGYLLFADK